MKGLGSVWLYVPSTESISAPASACSALPSSSAASSSASDPAVWLTLSGTHTQRPLSWRGWKTRPWNALLFGTISNRLMAERGAAEWSASLPVSRANRGRRRAKAKASTTHAGSGPSSRESSETRNLSWSSSKTSPALFQEVDFISYSTTLPKTGSMRSGYISERPTWAPVIGESASSCWPSARAEDSESCGNHPGAKDSLTGATREWATPNAMAGGSTSRGGDRVDEPLLGGQVQQWATPVSQPANGTPEQFLDRKRKAVANGSTMGICLSDLNLQTQVWATPNARDHKGIDLDSRNGGTSLSHQTQTGEFSHRDRQPTGETSPNTTGRRLNPAFVCWLMGWPWWWTRAERISFAAEEMASWRSKAQRLLSNLCSAR